MPSLTRVEAAERAATLRIHNYRITLDLPADGPVFTSETVIEFSAEDGASTFCDLKPVAVTAIELNGRSLDPSTLIDARLPLTGLRAENTLRVKAEMGYSSDGEGMHRHVDPADGRSYLYAMSFLDAAPRWFACFDQPDLKACFELEVHCDPSWRVLGNGAADRLGPGHWRLAGAQPLATYFVTLVAGPYHSIETEHDGIRLGVHARASLAAHLQAEAAELFEVTAGSLDRYHQLFGVRYPFGEYHQAFVADFNAGAMENPGCVTLRDQYVFRSAASSGDRVVRAATIAHEMAHMWFGDLVTMRWWDDLWLNESFAEYMGYRVCAELSSSRPGLAELAWTEFGIHRKDWGAVADQAPSTHPVAGNGSADAAAALADFDGISYAKGAAVLKQLAAHLGDEVFFAGLRLHFDRHAYGNAEFADLIRSWTDAGAVGLDGWAEQWLRTSGMDTVHTELAGDTLTVRRSSPDGSRRPHAVRVRGLDRHGAVLLDQPLTLTGDTAQLEAPGVLRLVVVDGADESWLKSRFGAAGFGAAGEDGWQPVIELLPVIDDPASRVVLYNALRDGVRDADLAPGRALHGLLGALSSEPVELVAADLLRFATVDLAGCFAPPEERAARRALVAGTALSRLAAAGTASDAQLEGARELIRASDDRELLRAWCEGRELPSGLIIDAELRWALVTRLAALGELSGADIDAELARDESTSGVVHAARARALRPDAAAKALAWRQLIEPSSLPAYELYATADGFFGPGQEQLTEQYLPRYFEQIPGTAEHRTGWALGRVALSAYPVAAASAQVLALAEDTLAGPGLDPSIRRSLVDGTDLLRRSVHSLQRYGGA